MILGCAVCITSWGLKRISLSLAFSTSSHTLISSPSLGSVVENTAAARRPFKASPHAASGTATPGFIQSWSFPCRASSSLPGLQAESGSVTVDSSLEVELHKHLQAVPLTSMKATELQQVRSMPLFSGLDDGQFGCIEPR